VPTRSCGGAITWPEYQAAGDAYLGLDTTIAAGDGVSTTECDTMDSILGSL